MTGNEREFHPRSPEGDAAMAPRQRLFIAVPCPLTPPIVSVLAELRAAQNAGGSGLRGVDPDTLHITLKFLGSVATDRTDTVITAMNAALREAPTVALQLKGAGSFHGALWLGVANNPQLTALAQRCDAAMEALGFAPERRPFRPHITVARLNNNPAFDYKAWTRLHRDTAWGDFTARTVYLYRSETLPAGARYKVLDSVALD